MDRRKKLLIIGGAWISAALLTWFLYARTVAPQQVKQVRVVVAARDLPLGTLMRPNDVKLVNYSEQDVPRGALYQTKDALGRVARFPLIGNEPLLTGKLSEPTAVEGMSSTIEMGYRAVSVQITDVSGVAGLIQTNSLVDVLFTRPGTMAEATTSTILQRVRVLSTGKLPQTGQTVDARTPKSPVVTLILTPEDAQKLELAKNEGRISLSLRNPLDASQAAYSGPLTTEVLDPLAGTRTKKVVARVSPGGNPDDLQVLRQLAAKPKKEEEKARVVVDVFRGDKHVQESFK